MPSYPKRTLKKHNNRAELAQAAVHLFATNGYEKTKLSDVANYVGLHVQTLYRHFKCKEELAIEAANSVLKRFEEFFESASSHQSPFNIWRAFVEHAHSELGHLGWQAKRAQLRSVSSKMDDTFILVVRSGYEDILTDHLAKYYQLDKKTDRLPRLAASFLVAADEAGLKRCAGLDTELDVLDDKDAVLREALGIIDEITDLFDQITVKQNLREY